jgi:hypothetical protein
MAKPKKRKSAGKAVRPQADPKPTQAKQPTETAVAPTAPAESAPVSRPEETDTPMHLPNAATLLDEVQQRCESLRQWQRDAQASLQERARVIERREKELDDTQKEVEVGRSRLELDQDAQKRARLMLDKERAQHEQSQQALEAERMRLDRARCELNDQKQELQTLRSEMDAEWASLARVRRAQESLGAALEADRARVQELKLTDRLGDPNTEPSDPGIDDTPGLSLTQAA